jgi:hypothetical protein
LSKSEYLLCGIALGMLISAIVRIAVDKMARKGSFVDWFIEYWWIAGMAVVAVIWTVDWLLNPST